MKVDLKFRFWKSGINVVKLRNTSTQTLWLPKRENRYPEMQNTTTGQNCSFCCAAVPPLRGLGGSAAQKEQANGLT